MILWTESHQNSLNVFSLYQTLDKAVLEVAWLHATTSSFLVIYRVNKIYHYIKMYSELPWHLCLKIFGSHLYLQRSIIAWTSPKMTQSHRLFLWEALAALYTFLKSWKVSDGQQIWQCIYYITVSYVTSHTCVKKRAPGNLKNTKQWSRRSKAHTQASHNTPTTSPISSPHNPNCLETSHNTYTNTHATEAL